MTTVTTTRVAQGRSNARSCRRVVLGGVLACLACTAPEPARQAPDLELRTDTARVVTWSATDSLALQLRRVLHAYDDGTLLVSGYGPSVLLRVNPKTRGITGLARNGQGPGELTGRVASAHRARADTVLLRDNALRLHTLAPDGRLVSEVRVDEWSTLDGLCVLNDGTRVIVSNAGDVRHLDAAREVPAALAALEMRDRDRRWRPRMVCDRDQRTVVVVPPTHVRDDHLWLLQWRPLERDRDRRIDTVRIHRPWLEAGERVSRTESATRRPPSEVRALHVLDSGRVLLIVRTTRSDWAPIPDPRAQRQAADSMYAFRAVIASLPDGIVLTDQELDIDVARVLSGTLSTGQYSYQIEQSDDAIRLRMLRVTLRPRRPSARATP